MKHNKNILRIILGGLTLTLLIGLNAPYAFNDNSVKTVILQAEAAADDSACVDIDFSDGARPKDKPYQSMGYCATNGMNYMCKAQRTAESCRHHCP